MHDDLAAGLSGGAWLPVRRPSENLPCADVCLTLRDLDFAADKFARLRLSVDALCANRDIRRLLSVGKSMPALRLDQGAASVPAVVPAHRPAEPLCPPPSLLGELYRR